MDSALLFARRRRECQIAAYLCIREPLCALASGSSEISHAEAARLRHACVCDVRIWCKVHDGVILLRKLHYVVLFFLFCQSFSPCAHMTVPSLPFNLSRLPPDASQVGNKVYTGL